MAIILKSPGRLGFISNPKRVLLLSNHKICAMFCAHLFISWKTSTKLPAQSNLRGTQQCICDASRAHLSIIAPLASPPCIAQFFWGSAVGMALTTRLPASFLRIVWQKHAKSSWRQYIRISIDSNSFRNISFLLPGPALPISFKRRADIVWWLCIIASIIKNLLYNNQFTQSPLVPTRFSSSTFSEAR